MSCGCTDTTPCGTPDCGCKFEVEAGCVRYTGESLGATDIVEGDTLDTILKTLNTKFEEYGPGDYIELEDEAAGTNCTYGGIKIILRDGDDHSIKSTKYVCGVDATSTLDGSGTFNTIAMWTPDGNSLGDSIITQSGTVATVGGTIKITGGSPGLGKFLKSDADGDGSWSTITASDISGIVDTTGGTANYLSKFTDTNTIEESQIQDDGTNIGIFTSPSPSIGVYIEGNTSTHNNVIIGNGFKVGAIGVEGASRGAGSSENIGVRGIATSSTLRNFGGYMIAGAITTGENIGMYAKAIAGATNYSTQLQDGTEASGKFLKSVTADGKTNWANITESDITGFGAYVKTDGTTPLTANWDAGSFTITSNKIVSTIDATVNSLTVGKGTGNISSNTAIGVNTLLTNVSGTNNLAAGFHSLYYNTTGSTNTAVGVSTLGANTTGSSNTAVGTSSAYSNSIGSSNTSVGAYSMFTNTTGSGITAVGTRSLEKNLSGNYNSAFGFSSMYTNTIGAYNTALGYSALYYNLSGGYNTAAGHQALENNTTSTGNAGFGYRALGDNQTSAKHAAFGYNTLASHTTGDDNTAMGYNSGNVILDGSTPNTGNTNNIFIGAQTKSAALTTSNEIVIGAYAIGNGDNTTTIGTTSTTAVYLHGNLNLKNTTAVQIATVTSDRYLDITINGTSYKLLLAL